MKKNEKFKNVIEIQTKKGLSKHKNRHLQQIKKNIGRTSVNPKVKEKQRKAVYEKTKK